MKDIVEVAYDSHKPKSCAVYMNVFHSILFFISYKKTFLSQFLFKFKWFVCNNVLKEYFVSLNVIVLISKVLQDESWHKKEKSPLSCPLSVLLL